MKKHLSTIRFLVFVIFLITVGIIAYDKPEDAFSIKTNGDSGDIDQLFRDMGILKIPASNRPIEISLMDLNGKEVRLSDFRGKIVFLNFWATWCLPCRVEMPSMEKLHKRLKHKDFVMVAIDLQEPTSRVKKFFEENKLTFICLLDLKGKVGDRYGVKSLPTTFILDKAGRIIGKTVEPREWDSQKAIALFERLIDVGTDTSS
jgi:peroxiredoxin